MQVIERHIVQGLEGIFSPLTVNGLSSSEAEAIAAEALPSKRLRAFVEDQIRKLTEGRRILRDIVSGGVGETGANSGGRA